MCQLLAAQYWPVPWSEEELTFSRLSTPSVRWIPTASEGPLLVTLTVKVCPEVPALAEASWNALSTASDTERWMSTEAVSVSSVGWPAAELLSFPTRRSSDLEEATA